MKDARDDTLRDEALRDRFAALEPPEEALDRMEEAALAAFDATQRSLAAEWVELLRVRPAAHGVLTLAAALALLIVTPLGSLLLSLLGR